MLITLAGFVGKMKVRGKSWQWTRRWHTSHTFRTESALAGVISLGWPILALSGYLSTPADAQTSIPSVLGMKLSGILGVPFFYWSCTLAWKPPLRMAASEHRVHFVTNSKCPYAQRESDTYLWHLMPGTYPLCGTAVVLIPVIGKRCCLLLRLFFMCHW